MIEHERWAKYFATAIPLNASANWWRLYSLLVLALMWNDFFLLAATNLKPRKRNLSNWTSFYQGCGVGVEESEGFWTWGVGVAENFDGSGLTFCSPIVTVCATNVRKRHTWQFKQLNLSTKDDHGWSERLQHTNSHAYTQGRFQVSSDTGVHHATYAEWVQPFEVCVTEISICFHSGWHYRCSVTLVTQQWTSKKFSWELHYYVSHVTDQW